MNAPLLLEYGGPRPVFRVQPFRAHVDLPDDPSPLIEPEFRRAGAHVNMYSPPKDGWKDYVPEAPFRHSPFIEVCTAPTRAWKSGTDDRYTSRFFVRGRDSFRAAYRVARMIAAGRPAWPATNWGGWEILVHAEVAPAHLRLLSEELAEERGLEGVSDCRACGCTDESPCEGGCEWDQPDLCSACAGQGPTKWIAVTAELPDADQTVMIGNAVWSEPAWLGYLDGDDWRTVEGSLLDGDDTDEDAPPTHWQPLPEPPPSVTATGEVA